MTSTQSNQEIKQSGSLFIELVVAGKGLHDAIVGENCIHSGVIERVDSVASELLLIWGGRDGFHPMQGDSVVHDVGIASPDVKLTSHRRIYAFLNGKWREGEYVANLASHFASQVVNNPLLHSDSPLRLRVLGESLVKGLFSSLVSRDVACKGKTHLGIREGHKRLRHWNGCRLSHSMKGGIN
jgi:hypothetical protein